MILIATRLKLRRWYFLPVFVFHNFRVTSQIKKAPGFVKARLLLDRGLAFWTVSAWRDEKAMLQFRNSGSHLAAMPHLRRWCNEAHVTRWEHASAELPTWPEVYEKLRSVGKSSRVDFPSPAQAQRRFAQPRVLPNFDQTLSPTRDEDSKPIQ